MRQPLLAGIMIVLVGCASLHATPDPIDPGDVVVAAERQWNESPTIGLALSGGGSKSAPFAMGVLAGLEESGVLPKIDVLSSVSGGSYAALYYYTRTAEMDQHVPNAAGSLHAVFADCLPVERETEFSAPFNWSQSTLYGLCPKGPQGTYWRNMWDPALADDPLRFASQLRATQNFLKLGEGWTYEGTSSPSNRIGAKALVTSHMLLNSLVLFPPQFIANTLFDWRVNVSSSRYFYNQGIRRTYGATPALMQYGDKGRRPGSLDVVNSLSLDQIRERYETGRGSCVEGLAKCSSKAIPLWVINATAGTSSTPFLLTGTGETRPDINVFELTPYGYGSGGYGFRTWKSQPASTEPSRNIAAAVGASAAFFDPQQRVVGGHLTQPLINAGLRLANLEWGTSIPNYGLSPATFRHNIGWHRLMPWPLYLLHRHKGDRNALRIQLSDGGMSENLGVWALLQRHIRDIVVVDGASDPEFRLTDLCELHEHLIHLPSDRMQSVVILGVPTFHTKCEQRIARRERDPYGLKHAWSTPLLAGTICKGNVATCEGEDVVANLFVIKPALNRNIKPSGGYSLADAVQRSKVDPGQCRLEPGATLPTKAYPCEVVAFVMANRSGTPLFPQHSTIRMTALSSPFLFGAYRELGRYYARTLCVDETRPGERHIRSVDIWKSSAGANTCGS